MPESTDFLRTAQPYILPQPFSIAHLEEAVQRMLAVQSGAQA